MSKFYITLVFVCLSFGEDRRSFSDFVNTFKPLQSKSITRFASFFEKGSRIEKTDAIKFIYRGDTSNLHCLQRQINMETEKVERTYLKSYLPRRVFRVEYPTFTLLCYETYECDNSMYLVYGVINLEILDKKFERRDRIKVQRASDFDTDLAGMLNPETARIFLLASESLNQEYMSASILKVNGATLKFEEEVKAKNLRINIDNPNRMLKTLNWESLFTKK